MQGLNVITSFVDSVTNDDPPGRVVRYSVRVPQAGYDGIVEVLVADNGAAAVRGTMPDDPGVDQAVRAEVLRLALAFLGRA